MTTESTEMRAVAQAISAVAAGTANSQGNSVQRSDKGGRKGTASSPMISSPLAPRKNRPANRVPNAAAPKAETK